MTLKSVNRAKVTLNRAMDSVVTELAVTYDDLDKKDEKIVKLEAENDELRVRVQELEQKLLKLEDLEEEEVVH